MNDMINRHKNQINDLNDELAGINGQVDDRDAAHDDKVEDLNKQIAAAKELLADEQKNIQDLKVTHEEEINEVTNNHTKNITNKEVNYLNSMNEAKDLKDAQEKN